MKKLWWIPLLVVSGCGAKPAQSCATVSTRPTVSITWKLIHGSMDNDPPRAKVKTIFGAPVSKEIDLGELFGNCAMSDVGKLVENAPAGSRVSELVCTHGNVESYATIYVLEPGKVVLRRFERIDDQLKPARDVQTIETPPCAEFVSELAQGGDL